MWCDACFWFRSCPTCLILCDMDRDMNMVSWALLLLTPSLMKVLNQQCYEIVYILLTNVCCDMQLITEHQAKTTTFRLTKFFCFPNFSFYRFWFLGRLIDMSLSSSWSKKVLSTFCQFPSCPYYLILKTKAIRYNAKRSMAIKVHRHIASHLQQ